MKDRNHAWRRARATAASIAAVCVALASGATGCIIVDNPDYAPETEGTRGTDGMGSDSMTSTTVATDTETDTEVNTDAGNPGGDGCTLESGFNVIGPPRRIKELNTNGAEFAPWAHNLGDRLYFTSDGWGGKGGAEILYASRDGSGSEFFKPEFVESLNTETNDSYFRLEEGWAYFISERQEGFPNLWAATHLGESTFGDPVLLGLNDGGWMGGPYPVRDRLYYAHNDDDGAPTTMKYADTAGTDFEEPEHVPLDDETMTDRSPWLTPDEKTIAFEALDSISGNNRIFQATRDDRDAQFGDREYVELMPIGNEGEDKDPFVSLKTCELFFASNRRLFDGGTLGNFDLYVVDIEDAP